MNLQEVIRHVERNPHISLIDKQFGKFILQGAKNPSVDLFLTAILLSDRTQHGNVCMDLTQFAGKTYRNAYETIEGVKSHRNLFEMIEGSFPEYPRWKILLERSQVVVAPETAHPLITQENCSPDYAPMVLQKQYLYLYRYWYYEKKLVDLLKNRLSQSITLPDPRILSPLLNRYFPEQKDSVDWQKIAVAGAILQKQLYLISGGPGTGKTSTVVKLLAILIEQSVTFPLVQIAAPTGKAAQRLQESIVENKQKLPCSTEIKNLIPEKVSTLHRLMQYSPESRSFRYDELNPLPVDILVVDEASMIDLELMTKLVSALASKTQLILLGDHHQLTSIEAGWVFGSLCETKQNRPYSKIFLEYLQSFFSTPLPFPYALNSESAPGIQDSVLELQKSYRFSETSGIKQLSQAVIQGKEELALEILLRQHYSDILWTPLPEIDNPPYFSLLRDRIIEGFRDYLTLPVTDIKNIFHHFSRFRILCGITKTEMGVEIINVLVEKILQEVKMIESNSIWYRGRPVMITKNDYSLQLFNGDIGITLPDPQSPETLKVYFPESATNYRAFLPQRLPKHETAYAITVQKSQGSEFERVLFLLPFVYSRVFTRELVYTAITRAKKQIEIFGKESLLKQSIQKREERLSRLTERLLE